jgi:hypothetical protein
MRDTVPEPGLQEGTGKRFDQGSVIGLKYLIPSVRFAMRLSFRLLLAFARSSDTPATARSVYAGETEGQVAAPERGCGRGTSIRGNI